MNATEKRALIPLLKRVLNDTINHGTKSTARYWLHRLQKPRAKPSAQRKEAKAAQHREETGALRAAVFQRAGDACELGSGLPPAHLHHLEGGSGRRALQKISNCMAVSESAHLAYHRNPEAFREVVLAWCAKYDYPIPRRFRAPPKTALPTRMYCDRCDGCGWYEGGPTLQTTCEKCGGTGTVIAQGRAQSAPSNALKSEPVPRKSA